MLFALGEIHAVTKRYNDAVKALREAADIYDDGDRRMFAHTLILLGDNYSDLDRTDDAIQAYNQALLFWRSQPARKAGDPAIAVEVLLRLGRN